MMDRTEVRIAGFGGQGVVVAGVILGRALALYEGKNVVQTQLYGPESRGGAARSEVVYAEGVIDYPKVELADILVLMSQEAADKYGREIKAGATVLIDPELVHFNRIANEHIYAIRATGIAYEMGNKIAANMVMLGALAAISRIASLDSIKRAIRDVLGGGLADFNMRACERGYEEGKRLKEAEEVWGLTV